MKPQELRLRLEAFAITVLRVTKPLLASDAASDIVRQLRRSATSIAQNYAAATIARSRRDFASKLRIALEEADETARWLRLLRAADIAAGEPFDDIIEESLQIAAILGASCRTVKQNDR